MNVPDLRTAVHVVDHTQSDDAYHAYCDACYEQIPGFLVRWEHAYTLDQVAAMRHHDFDVCEGCRRVLVTRT